MEKKPQHTPPSRKDSGTNLKTLLSKLALKLYDLGFNVIPVSIDKRPLTRWSPRGRLSREELERLLGRADGVALVGGLNPWFDVGYILLIVDVDNPRVLENTPTLRRLIEETVSWKTGPRCPRCYLKELDVLEEGSRFRCKSCYVEFTLEEAPRGLGALFTASREAFEKLTKGTVRFKDVELLYNNYQLIPPSKHKAGVRYEWVRPPDFTLPNLGIYSLEDVELEAIWGELRKLGASKPVWVEAEKRVAAEVKVEGATATRQARVEELRELSPDVIGEIVEHLRGLYQPGYRQHLWLNLSGAGAKCEVSPLSIARVLKQLYEEAGDTDSLRTRASAIVYSYKKAGVNVGVYAKEFEDTLGVKPYGLEREIREEDVKGRSGLQEILESVLGEAESLEVIRGLEEIFGRASPYRDSIIEVLDFEKQLYAVANLRKLIVARARRVEGRGLVYRERVFIGAPTSVIVYVNPVGGVTKYKVVWEVSTRPKPVEIGPAYIGDVLDRLRAEGLVTAGRFADDVLNAVIEGFIRRGRAEVRAEIESPGFYYVDGRVVAVGFDVREPVFEELREALILLDELAVWYKHVLDRFATVVKWGLLAPFNYVLKQRGRWVRWLYLYGASRTGKTTLGEVVLKIWGLGAGNTKTGGSIDTPARLGYVLSQSTFPVLVNEPGNALSREDIVEIVKNAVESTVVRGKYHRGSYVEIPSLAAVIFTSNKYIPRDDALLRRLQVLRFTYGERVEEGKAAVFERDVKPRLDKLRALGVFTAWYVTSNASILGGEDPARAILEEAYRRVGLELPQWVGLKVAGEECFEESIVEDVRSFLRERVNNAFFKAIREVYIEGVSGKGELPLKDRVRIVLEKQLLPWADLRDNEVVITTGVLGELKDVIGDIGGLKSLAELLGWEYGVRKVGGKPVRCIVAKLEDFINFLAGVE